MDKVKVAAEHKNAEGGLLAVKALAETKHSAAEAYVVAMLPILMDKYADKVLDCPCLNWLQLYCQSLVDVTADAKQVSSHIVWFRTADAACNFVGPFTISYDMCLELFVMTCVTWTYLLKWSSMSAASTD